MWSLCLPYGLAARDFEPKPCVDGAEEANAAAEKAIRTALANWTRAANQQDWKTALNVWASDLIGWPADGADDTYQRGAEFAAHPTPSRTTYSLTVNENRRRWRPRLRTQHLDRDDKARRWT
jgi:hypothetical protein